MTNDLESKIKILEQWRDWYWQSYIKHKSSRVTIFYNHKERAEAYQNAIDILNGVNIKLPEPNEGFTHIKFGEYLPETESYV